MSPRLGVLTMAVAAGLLAAAPARAADKAAIDAAVEKGVQHLKGLQRENGMWPHEQIGLTALAGLTLLECGVPADDDAIQKAAAIVRYAAVDNDQTYSIALTILFLDRLGEAVDVALIESLTVRLLAGQNALGGWTYTCPKGDFGEQRRLSNLVKQRNQLTAGEKPPRLDRRVQRTVQDMPKEIQAQLEQVRKTRATVGANPAAAMARGGMDDNSNTQFAVLALWVARRQGLPVDAALADTDKRFRRSQAGDGGWGYSSGGMASGMGAASGPLLPHLASGPAMTCAGLLGVGLAYGAWNENALRTDLKGKEPGKPGAAPPKPQDPSKDKTVVAGFRLLGAWVDGMAQGGKAPRVNVASGKVYYFLWSMERVAVAYGVDRFGKTDWYDWGSGVLLANQGEDGGWNNGEFRNGPDTCFALLFLKRANLAEDLTRALTSQMKEGMQTALRQGGAGGAELVRVNGRKPFFDGPVAEVPKEKPDADTQAARLGKQLAQATGEKQDEVLKELRDTKGAAYTQALASAIPQLEGEGRKKAREALAERLERMTSETLGLKLEDDDPEVRRAAALALAGKEDRTHVRKLIDLLNDPEPAVAAGAHAALKSLNNDVDLGPPKGAGREERAKAVLAWKAWWSKMVQEKPKE